ncbi:MAG: serine dehydrogenasease [Polyangiaceae bacterium]|nr:serine dehydrogenasease [Polyangiaceae bacterium]
MSTLNSVGQDALNERLVNLEKILDADVLTLVGPIRDGVEHKVRAALEGIKPRRGKLAAVLQTGGGIVEVAERMVHIVRHFYNEVVFIIPDVAMSAGTVFAMSGDAILMDYFSALGPIDPQVVRDNKLVPALSYLQQYERLIDKATAGTLTNAEFALLSKFDQAELHQFEMARDLSVSLLMKWLAKYKFKDWNETEVNKRPVTAQDREERAKEIALQLIDNRRWGSHGRGIPMQVLQEELNLKIDDFGRIPALKAAIRSYFDLTIDYIQRNEIGHFAHSRCYI